MLRAAIALAFACTVFAAEARYEIRGTIPLEGSASVSLHGAVTAHYIDGTVYGNGQFEFKKVPPGVYNLVITMPSRGEARRTIDVGPATAGGKKRIDLVLDLRESDFIPNPLQRLHTISKGELETPRNAQREFEAAMRDLRKPDVPAAVKRLHRAVEIAPAFSNAWNQLGTIAYQSRDFAHAEDYFRKSLQADPQAFEPLVNLGAALLSLNKLEESLSVNRDAVHNRPDDALANSQLGMVYFAMSQYDSALKYLNRASEIDPRHFSHPQLIASEIYARRNEPERAAASLEQFLRYHPDYPNAEKLRESIRSLRAR
jgi:tetratricopeptide (TPR) repeat protein